MDVIGKRKIYLSIAVFLVLVSIILVLVLGLKAGIDLKGGTSWQITMKNNPVVDEVRSFLKEKSGVGVEVKIISDGGFILRLPEINEAQHQKLLEELKNKFSDVEEENFSSIGPTIGSELKRKAVWSILFVMLGISLYIARAFRKVSEPIKSWKYGLVTLITLVHDVVIPTGLIALLGYWKGIEMDTNFIVALLVVMGFSVHDTIVVFDRIRENLLLYRPKNIPLEEIINRSVRETFARSVNTSLTLVIILITLMIFGPPPLFYFILTILVGTIMGTYSSIFVASPLLYLSRGKRP